MKTLSLTEAKRRLDELACAAEPVEITRRGQRIGEIRGAARPEVLDDRERSMAAARRIRDIGMRSKPSKTHGGAQAIRRLRDGR